jgi:hypothetical protein
MTPLLTGVFASQISGRLNTFTLAGSYDALGTVTVPSGGLSSITFAGIPAIGYSHLQIRTMNQTNRATYNTDDFRLNFNSDTASNYAWHQLNSPPSSSSTVVASAAASSTTSVSGFSTASNVATNIFGAAVIDILDYASNVKNKTVRGLSGADTNGAASGYAGFTSLNSGAWFNTTPINSITFYPNYGSLFLEKSTFALYGVK